MDSFSIVILCVCKLSIFQKQFKNRLKSHNFCCNNFSTKIVDIISKGAFNSYFYAAMSSQFFSLFFKSFSMKKLVFKRYLMKKLVFKNKTS